MYPDDVFVALLIREISFYESWYPLSVTILFDKICLGASPHIVHIAIIRRYCECVHRIIIVATAGDEHCACYQQQ